MVKFREPLILPCAAFAAGILAARYARFAQAELIAAFLLLSLAAIASRRLAPRCAWIAFACCMWVGGAAVAEYHRPPPAPVMDAEPGELLLVSGCVVEPLSKRDGRGRFAMEIEPGARANVSFRIYPEAPAPDIRYGSLVEFPARVRPPRNFGNPGAFDYAGYLARRHTYWLASVQSRATIQILPGSCGLRAEAVLTNFRQAALHRLDALYPEDPAASGFLRALVLGNDDHLEVATSEDFRKTGTFHAIVVSGLHISLVAGSLLWLLGRIFVPLWFRLPAAGIAAWVYTLVAGGEAPVLRAAIGFTLALVATACFRRVPILNILAAVALIFLVWDPGQLFEPSFQLSFLAVAAIGAIAAPLLDRTSKVLRSAAGDLHHLRPNPSITPETCSLRIELRLLAETVAVVTRMRPKIADFLVTATARVFAAVWEMVLLSAAVQFALTLPAVLYFHRVPVTSVLANLFAVPLLNGAVGFGLTGLLAGSRVLVSAAVWLVKLAEWFVAFFAKLEPDWRPPRPEFWLAIAFAASLILLAAALRKKPRFAFVPGALSVGLALWICVFQGAVGQRGWLELSAIDVGQGDSLLIVFPEGQTMLVDGGGVPSFRGNAARRMDIGEQVVSAYLWERGIRHIDVIAMTHAHDDHAQGLPALVRNFHPNEVWTGATPISSAGELLKQAGLSGARVRQPQAGHVERFGPASVRVLAPATDYLPSGHARNNDSLVLEVTYGKRRFVLTGDAERAVESELAANGMLRPVDVLKVGHHGSKSSTTDALLEMAKPVFAVISVGDGNLYGHPHPDVMARLHQAGVQIFRTDRNGLTSFRTDGNKMLVETNSPNWIRAQ